MSKLFLPKVRGFTVIEVLVAVAIVAILIAIGVPRMNDMVVTVRLRSAASDLYESVIFARSEAIKRNGLISVVPSAGGWAGGWQIKVDADNTVLRTSEALSNVAATPDVAGNITFAMTGRVTTAVRRVVFSTGVPNVRARCLMIDVSGRPTVRVDNDGDASNGCI